MQEHTSACLLVTCALADALQVKPVLRKAHMRPQQSLGDLAAALLQLLDLDVSRWALSRFMLPEYGDTDCLAFDSAAAGCCLLDISISYQECDY